MCSFHSVMVFFQVDSNGWYKYNDVYIRMYMSVLIRPFQFTLLNIRQQQLMICVFHCVCVYHQFASLLLSFFFRVAIFRSVRATWNPKWNVKFTLRTFNSIGRFTRDVWLFEIVFEKTSTNGRCYYLFIINIYERETIHISN